VLPLLVEAIAVVGSLPRCFFDGAFATYIFAGVLLALFLAEDLTSCKEAPVTPRDGGLIGLLVADINEAPGKICKDGFIFIGVFGTTVGKALGTIREGFFLIELLDHASGDNEDPGTICDDDFFFVDDFPFRWKPHLQSLLFTAFFDK